ncbi:MAG: hypothetical protein ABW106_13640 [Steroidobacteraceae bacterium]
MKRLTFLIGATLLSAAAFAAGEPVSPPDAVTAAFESLDKNADEQISKTEAASDKAVSDSFASADANGDGYLSKAEFTDRNHS